MPTPTYLRPCLTTTRSAAGVLAAAALTGGLLATAPTTASAAPAAGPVPTSVRYDCTGPLGLMRLGVEVDLTNLPDEVPTGLPVPRGLVFDISIDFPTDLFGGLLGGLFGGGAQGSVEDFFLGFGDRDLPVADVVEDIEDPGTDPVLDGAARTRGFQVPAPGDYDITLPDTFSFAPLSILGVELFSIDCRLRGDEVVDEVEVDEQESDTDVEVLDPDPGGSDGDTEEGVEDGTPPVVLTRVTRELGGQAAGRVVATVGSRVVGRAPLRRGAARLRLDRSAEGRRVVVRYLGNATTDPSRSVVRVPR